MATKTQMKAKARKAKASTRIAKLTTKRNARGESPSEQAMREADEQLGEAKKPARAAKQTGEWLTPTQIGKEEGMPNHALQLIYGYIRSGKLEARNVEGVKGKVVDAALAREMVANRGSRGGSRGPRPSVKRKASGELAAGTIVSSEGFTDLGGDERTRKPRGKRDVRVVTHHVGSLTYGTEGERDMFWQTESLAQRIKEGKTQIESPAKLLAIIAYSWRRNDDEALAKQLMDWCSGRVNEAGDIYNRLIGLKAEELEQGREEAPGEE